MRRTVQIAGGVESLFGTLDENVKLLESALRVTTQLEDGHLAIEGEAAQVDRANDVHVVVFTRDDCDPRNHSARVRPVQLQFERRRRI